MSNEKVEIVKRISTLKAGYIYNDLSTQYPKYDSNFDTSITVGLVDYCLKEAAKEKYKPQVELKFNSQNQNENSKWEWNIVDYLVEVSKTTHIPLHKWCCSSGILQYENEDLRSYARKLDDNKACLLDIVDDESCPALLDSDFNLSKYAETFYQLNDTEDRPTWNRNVDWFFDEIFPKLNWKDNKNIILFELDDISKENSSKTKWAQILN